MIQCVGDIYAQWREVQQRQVALREASSLPAARATPPPAATEASQAASRRNQETPYRSLNTASPAPARPYLAQQLAAFQAALPGRRGEAYLQQRGIPLTLALQVRCGLCSAGHLAACRPRLAGWPRGLSPYDAERMSDQPLWACSRDGSAGPQGEAA